LKALVLESYMNLVYKEMPMPEYAADEVLVRVRACGICGSDVHGMDGRSGRRIPPLIMGHEAAGDIAEVGNNVDSWQKGDRVSFDSTIYKLDDWYTRRGMYNLSDNRMVLGVSPGTYRRHGAFADYIAVPQHILYKVPDSVSYNQATMVEPAAVALHAIGLTKIEINNAAVVVGAGMIGMFLIQLLRLQCCGKIIAIDTQQDRLDMAKELGADKTFIAGDDEIIPTIKEMTNGRGADIAFEAVGIEKTIKTAIHSVRRGATVTLVGNLSPTVSIPLQDVVTQQLRLQGSCAIAGEYPAILEMIASGRINVDKIMSATAPLSEGAEWFKRLYDKKPGLMKVVLNP
jgi:L-iditol 2-dehydrogenase